MKSKFGLLALVAMFIMSCACKATGAPQIKTAEKECTINCNVQFDVLQAQDLFVIENVIALDGNSDKAKVNSESETVVQRMYAVEAPPLYWCMNSNYISNLHNLKNKETNKAKGFNKESDPYIRA